MHILTLAGCLLFPAALPVSTSPSSLPGEALVAQDLPAEGPTGGAKDSLFAPASEALAFAWPEDSEGITVLDVVQAYGSVTGQRLAMTQETRQVLGQTSAPLDRATSVPAGEVQGFVESLLRSSSCVMTVDRASEPRLIGVHSLKVRGSDGIRARAMHMESTRLEVLRRHPAVLFSTVIHLPNLDARQISNSLRTTITDANTSQILPVGTSNSMLITGFGPRVADHVEYLGAINAANETPTITVSHALVPLTNASASDLAPLVERALSISRELRHPHPAKEPMRSAKVSVIADSRLNGLLVTCHSEDLEEARAIIEQLDVK